ncbi:probable ATP-dependent RNA helicase DDX28 [Ornithodoros turicata]|uniref:probable ATP-dependent RNA helicase DDX28 n=1 Tax=Ornithodoros turicata TaxID=34597 RepID=UPI00313972CD
MMYSHVPLVYYAALRQLAQKTCPTRFGRHVHGLVQSESNIPTITTPVYLEHKLKKLKQKYEAKKIEEIRKKSRQGKKDHPVITCKRPELNFYLHQTYLDNEEVPLASKGWFHRKSRGDHFTIHRLSGNPSLSTGDETSDSDDENSSFENYRVHPLVLSGLHEMGIRRPTLIQQEAIPAILKNHNVLCSAETGSGKTLAYLAPIMTSLLAKRALGKPRVTKAGAPQVLILAPGRELGVQIGDVAQTLGQHCSIKVATLIGQEGIKGCEEAMEVVVATAGTVVKLRKKGILDLSLLSHVVIDEVDTLLDDSFSAVVTRALEDVKVQGSVNCMPGEGVQLMLVGATLPSEIVEPLGGLIEEENLLRVSTPQLHRLLPHVQHKFLRLRPMDKAGALMDLVKKDVNAGRACMVFANATHCCDWIAGVLGDCNVPVTKLHGYLSAQLRKENYDKFLSGEALVLACTDLGSRGLDTTHVEHVLNFDFPHHMSDYIHRIGRIGRVGSRVVQGFATNFVITPPQVELTQKIELAARRTKALPRVDANISRFLDERNTAKEFEAGAKEQPGNLEKNSES